MVTSRPGLRIVSFLLIAGLLIVLSVGLARAQADDAGLRFAHGGHGIGPVDVYVDDDLAIEALEYAGVTAYLDLPPGDHELQVTATGESTDAALLDMQVMLEAGTPHTVVAIGPAEAPDLIVIVDDHSPPSGGAAYLTVINATSDSTDVALNLADGTALIEEVPFADASEYIEIQAGAYDFSIVSIADGVEIATIPGFSADAGSIYSVFVMGVAGDYTAVAVEDMLDEADSPAEVTATEPARTPTTPDGTPTVTTTPAGTATVTTTPDATATVIPSLPATGSGGASSGASLVPALAGLVALAVVLAGMVTWRLGLWTPGKRR